jgi:GWxTD domain-containing protein
LKKIFLFLFLIFTAAYAQEKISPIFIEHNSLLSDSGQVEVFSYRIPYKNLLFIKGEENFTAKFTLSMEFFLDDNFVKRQIVQPEFSVNNYTETLSDQQYFQDFYTLTLEPGKYQIKSDLNLESTELDYKIPDFTVQIDSIEKSKIFVPLVVNYIDQTTSNNFILTNFGNFIPFSPEKYDLLFGIIGNYTSGFTLSIKQFDKEIYSKAFNTFTKGNGIIKKFNNDLVLKIDSSGKVYYYLVSNFSNLLYEGLIILTIKYNGEVKDFDLLSMWINKPRVLSNLEYAIRLLQYVENDEIIGNLLSLDEEEYAKALTDYWNEKYPANGTKYNYAMAEFYKRADYSIEKFSSLNTFDGAERDRGRIYILYGEPTNIERNYSEMNEVLEIWEYKNIARKFIFKDVNGTGKFDLEK